MEGVNTWRMASCMTKDPAASTTHGALLARRHRGEISAIEYFDGLQQARDADYWHRWAMRALLVLGASHFLAGVVFFFAYNWDDLSTFAKFALLQGALVGSFLAALALRIDRPAGQAALIGASVFTGVLLAVIGQTYQTGADAWELFVTWGVLILPWVLASRSSAHWALWVAVCITAVATYGEQRLVALGLVDRRELYAGVGLVPIAFLVLREVAVRLECTWLAERWTRRILVALGLGILFVPALQFVFDIEQAQPAFIVYLVVTLAVLLAYSTWLSDFPAVAIAVAFATLMGMAIGGRLIEETVGFDGSAGALVVSLLLLGGWCAMLTTGSVKALRFVGRRLSGGSDHDE